MAILKENMVFKGLSGRFGDAVYKVLRGKTIVTKPAKKSTSISELQQRTRTKFKEAAGFAKAAMLNAERKAYYQQKALKLKLPNAYTAALTDYMRKPKVKEFKVSNKPALLEVVKKDFKIKKVVIRNSDGTVREIKPECKASSTWFVELSSEDKARPVTIIVEDETGQLYTEILLLNN